MKVKLWFHLLFLLSTVVSGCAPFLNQTLQPGEVRLGAESSFHQELKNLPDPEEKVVAAVYKFRDQTGQYKPTEVGASWSTAITQGATSILQRALEESGWFITVEREGLANLLNERKIIRSSRQAFEQQQGSDEPTLPPLLFAGVLLEGGIISYDANVLTGGAGARYFGAGGNAQYRQDRVTVYLRATSTRNGRILKTVYTSRTILSQKVDVGLFRFVSFQRLLEAETGFTHNEPAELAVREAIEKAVHSLVIEGVMDELWKLKNPDEERTPLLENYQKEVQTNTQTNYLGGRINQFRRDRFRVNVSGGTFRYAGDYSNPMFRPSAEIQAASQVTPWLSVGAALGQGILAGEGTFEGTFNHASVASEWRWFPYSRFTPTLLLRGGVISEQGHTLLKGYPQMTMGIGGEFLINNRLSITGNLMHIYTFSDQLDGVTQGKYNDFFWSANIGLNLYFGK